MEKQYLAVANCDHKMEGNIMLDIADGTKQNYDELLLEQHGSICWLHFAVKPKDNRRKTEFLKV